MSCQACWEYAIIRAVRVSATVQSKQKGGGRRADEI